ncbi:MAG TPA: hypothetical protein VFI42_00445 [Thermomicrobiaceae bacterium]|nr:hypothetical protein [Thermomicrobiaceae bacterium]
MRLRLLPWRGSRIILAALVAIGGVILVGADRAAPGGAAGGRPATEVEQQQVVTLIHRYERVFFDGWVSGDLSAFPTVFYNDADEHLSPHWRSVMAAHQPEVTAILRQSHTGPIGASDGLLSAEMSDVLARRASDARWQEAEATLADVPGGQPPVITPRPGDWVDKQIFITEAVVFGDRTIVTYVLDSPDSTLRFHLHLLQVGGQWYLTNYGVTGSP